MSRKIKLSEIKFDDKNPNKPTDKSDKLLTTSMQRFGNRAASISDKNGIILDGNKRLQKHGELKISDEVEIIKGDPSKAYIIQYDDVDINTKEGRELSILLNTSAKESQMDLKIIEMHVEELEIEPKFVGIEMDEKTQKDLSDKIESKFIIETTCINESEQKKLYNELINQGYECRILTL